jgi:hypothetical protein
MVINLYSIIIIIAAIAIAGTLITVSFNNEEEQQVTTINLPEECLSVREIPSIIRVDLCWIDWICDPSQK